MLYDDSLVQGLEGTANVESHLNSILTYSQYWMRHTTLEIKFELKMESLHMVGTNIKQEYTEIGDSEWFQKIESIMLVSDFMHSNEFPYYDLNTLAPEGFPFNIVITMWYDNQSNSTGTYRGPPYDFGGEDAGPVDVGGEGCHMNIFGLKSEIFCKYKWKVPKVLINN